MTEHAAEYDALVEQVTSVIVGHQRIPLYAHIPYAQRCVGCDSLHGQSDGPNSPRHARHVAEQIIQQVISPGQVDPS